MYIQIMFKVQGNFSLLPLDIHYSFLFSLMYLNNIICEQMERNVGVYRVTHHYLYSFKNLLLINGSGVEQVLGD